MNASDKQLILQIKQASTELKHKFETAASYYTQISGKCWEALGSEDNLEIVERQAWLALRAQLTFIDSLFSNVKIESEIANGIATKLKEV